MENITETDKHIRKAYVGSSFTVRATFVPGTGLRYEALLIRMKSKVDLQYLGSVPANGILVVIGTGRAYLFSPTAPTLSSDYVKEKFDIHSQEEAVAWTYLIAHALRRETDARPEGVA